MSKINKEKIINLLKEINSFSADNTDKVNEFHKKYISKKGIINSMFSDFKQLPSEQKKELGIYLNELKKNALKKYNELKDKFNKENTESNRFLDISLPGDPFEQGAIHPITYIKNRIVDIFSKIGFTISEGPEIEDDWHNFTALNFPYDHPARDMQDTFFIKEKDIALRTHTSSVQVRVMENNTPPIRTISPGRVYRNEAISARAHCFFHQIEGLYVDKNVSFADLKQTLLYFAREMFGKDTKVRLRPSYFPFTEPSAEMDISCTICKGKTCALCKYSGFVEILGCGMVDPNVLDNCNIDSKIYTGFAFGMGIERIAQLKFRVNDIRLYSENNINFLKQFTSLI